LSGHYDVHTNMMQYPATMQPTYARIEQIRDPEESADPPSTMFPPIQPQMSRNFYITDTYLETPPTGISPASYELPFRTAADARDRRASDRADLLAPFRGLGAVSNEIRDLLPEECKGAFDEARRNEMEWHAKWGPEAESTSRKEPVIDKAIVPYTN
jgi:chromatin structure-remodeling complex protein RSC7